MADSASADRLVFGLGEEIHRCPKTGRAYEVGSGALSHAEQTANFVRERDRAADLPCAGERGPDGRPYETGSGCLTKTAQRAMWEREADPAQAKRDDERAAAVAAAAEMQRLAKVEADALAAMTPAGAA